MKSRGLLVVAALFLVACTPVVPTPALTPATLLSPSPTTTATLSSAPSVDCGPITDPKSCASAVQVALQLTKVPRSTVVSILIEPRSFDGCPSSVTCLVPTVVKLLNADGTELETILLAEFPDGVWGGYPVALGARRNVE